MPKPPPLVLCGPSGSGKSTLIKQLMKEFADYFGFSISHTTRSPRQGEENGREYHFVSRDVMETKIKDGDFIEYAEFSGNYYGTSKASIRDVQDKNKICILDIDVQGVIQIKQSDLNPRLVFLQPPSVEELEKRLRDRGTETPESLSKRLNAAINEMQYGLSPGNFDIIITNDDVDHAYIKLKDFILPDIQKIKK